MLTAARRAMRESANVVMMPAATAASPVTIVGDLHGSMEDLEYIIDTYGLPGPNSRYIFVGDYADRGRSLPLCICMWRQQFSSVVLRLAVCVNAAVLSLCAYCLVSRCLCVSLSISVSRHSVEVFAQSLLADHCLDCSVGAHRSPFTAQQLPSVHLQLTYCSLRSLRA